MPNLLLYPWNPMAGCDPHMEFGIVPPSPIPIPFPWTPHLVFMFLNGITDEPDMTTTVEGDGVPIIQLGSDIGSFIPHLPLPIEPPNLLFEVYTALSSSKSIFGPYSVMADKKPVAAALLYCENPQMNCNQAPLPLPLGLATTWGTILVDPTWAELGWNLADFAYDSFLDWLLEKGVGHFVKKVPLLTDTTLGKEGEERATSMIAGVISKSLKLVPGFDDLKDEGKPSHLLGGKE